MADIDRINEYLQSELNRRGLHWVSAVDAAKWLDHAGVLQDSELRRGLPLRNLLRDGRIRGQRQEIGRRWFIDRTNSGAWHLEPGDRILRKELRIQYGGSGEPGIAPSRKSQNIFVFSDPQTGEKYGYHDHWDGEILHYYGMGRYGPQKMEGNNKSLLEHIQTGRAVRVFQGVGGEVTYLGEFVVDSEEAYYWDEARDFESEKLRPVIVFKLRPAGGNTAAAPLTQDIAGRPKYRKAKENRKSAPAKTLVRDSDAIDRATNAHSELQNELEAFVRDRGAITHSPGSLDPAFDLAWEFNGTFFIGEVKSITSANESSQLRLALGQLLHYRHLMTPTKPHVQAVLYVERAPSYEGWVDLCTEHGVTLLWPEKLSTLKM